MQRANLIEILRRYKIGVVATVAADGAPQAATVGFAVGDDGALVFDTLTTTRKHANLSRERRVAIQIEGVAEEPSGDDLARVQRPTSRRSPMATNEPGGVTSRGSASSRPGRGSAMTARIHPRSPSSRCDPR